LILGAVAVAGLVAFAAPAHAQQQGSPINPDASAVNEQTLIRQSPRIEGQTDLLDKRERVLIQPAGRTWDHFHEVTLHWLGAAVILLGAAVLCGGAVFLARPLALSGPTGAHKDAPTSPAVAAPKDAEAESPSATAKFIRNRDGKPPMRFFDVALELRNPSAHPVWLLTGYYGDARPPEEAAKGSVVASLQSGAVRSWKWWEGRAVGAFEGKCGGLRGCLLGKV